MIIRGKAPLRISFAGGGTDISPYFNEYGGCVLNCTIGKHTYASLIPRDTPLVTIQSLDYGDTIHIDHRNKIEYNGKLDLAKAALKVLGIKDGCQITIRSDAPPGSGLGASASMATVLIGVLQRWKNIQIDNHKLAELAYSIERDELKIQGGKQDQYATAFGGFNFIEFYHDNTVVQKLQIRQDVLNELTYRGLLCYTKRSIDGPAIISDQITSYIDRKADVTQALHNAKAYAKEMKSVLLSGKVNEFCQLMHESWENKKNFSPMITNPTIEEIYETARKNGAIGGKLLGAGGGGYLLLFSKADKRNNLVEALRHIEVGSESVTFDMWGLQTWIA